MGGSGPSQDGNRGFQFFISIRFLFQQSLVNGEALKGVFPEDLGGPDPELGALLGIDPISHGNDGIEVEVFHLIGLAILGSYGKKCNDWWGKAFPLASAAALGGGRSLLRGLLVGRALRADAFQEFFGGFVVGILGDELACEGLLQDAFL